MSGAFNNFPSTATTPSQQRAAAGLAGNAYMVVQALGNDPSAYTPTAGEWYAVDAGAIGEWAGYDGQLACWLGTGWLFHFPIDTTLISPANVGGTIYYSTAGTWAPFLPNGVTPTGYMSVNGSAGSDPRPAPLDHGHTNVAQANGDTFGDTTNRWNMRIGGLDPGRITLSTGGWTYNLALLASGSTVAVIWAVATTGNGAINLPAAVEGRYITIQLTITGANTITVTPAGTDTLNNVAGATALGVASNDTHKHLTCDAAGAWRMA